MIASLILRNIIFLSGLTLSSTQSEMQQFNGFDLSPLTAKKHWMFKNEKGFNFFTGQMKHFRIYVSFAKHLESMLSLVLIINHVDVKFFFIL
jgi:hypothetical protein